MLSSNSGFQRVSQAALSRSRFLRLAAGALFPFVGWRISAAAAPYPEVLQSSRAPGTKDTEGRMGAILVSQFGSVKIHSYLSPADGLQVNTQMIEGPNAVVIFDGQLLLPYAGEVASYVQMLGKPIDRIILSHAHTDHWGGLQVLTECSPWMGSPTRSAPEARRGSMACAGLTATKRRRTSPCRRKRSWKVSNELTASPMTSSASSTPNRICSSPLCCPSKKC